jgi:hypothetical protein
MEFERMLNESHEPSDEELLTAIGAADLWLDLRQYLEQNYDFQPELVFYGKKYGWTIRYRKSGKTLCSLFPEHGAFTVLVVLGQQEGEKSVEILDELSPATQTLIGSATQLHDGKWLWIRVLKRAHVEDVKLLLAAKRKPLAK